MSRVAKKPIELPKGVEVKLSPAQVGVKGPKGETSISLHPEVLVEQQGASLQIRPKSDHAAMMAGTTRALLSNMVVGVTKGFEKKLELVGVGYRAQSKGKSLSLTLGFSHTVDYSPPAGVTIETPSQTEIIIKGIDKQKVGQVAAEIRGFRKPEPYKGKGVKYVGEHIVRKEAKKK